MMMEAVAAATVVVGDTIQLYIYIYIIHIYIAFCSFCEGCAYSNLQVKYVRKHIHKHRLVYKVRNNYICDMGDECIRVVQGKGDEDRLVGFGCEECDYDLCGECCEKFERAPTQEELMGEVDDEADDVGFGLLGTLVSRRNIK